MSQATIRKRAISLLCALALVFGIASTFRTPALAAEVQETEITSELSVARVGAIELASTDGIKTGGWTLGFNVPESHSNHELQLVMAAVSLNGHEGYYTLRRSWNGSPMTIAVTSSSHTQVYSLGRVSAGYYQITFSPSSSVNGDSIACALVISAMSS